VVFMNYVKILTSDTHKKIIVDLRSTFFSSENTNSAKNFMFYGNFFRITPKTKTLDFVENKFCV